MKIQPLIATMYMTDYSFLKEMNIESDYVIINQTDFKKFPNLNFKNDSNVLISNEERGLSKSRNLALKNSDADICLVSDDDIKFIKNYKEVISNIYKEIPDADIIIYNYETSDTTRKCSVLGDQPRKLSYYELLKVSSVRISFKRKAITDRNINFNTLFGAGSFFPSGEENLFLKNCYERGLNIYYYPKVICDVNFDTSSWFTGFNIKYFEGKGALSYAFWGKLYHIYNFYFVFSKYNYYKGNLSLYSALKAMYRGKSLFEGKRNGK